MSQRFSERATGEPADRAQRRCYCAFAELASGIVVSGNCSADLVSERLRGTDAGDSHC